MPQRTVWHRSGIAVPTERNVPAYSCVLAESRGPVENSSGRLAQLVLFLRLARSGGTGRRSRLKICRSFALCGFDSLLRDHFCWPSPFPVSDLRLFLLTLLFSARGDNVRAFCRRLASLVFGNRLCLRRLFDLPRRRSCLNRAWRRTMRMPAVCSSSSWD